MTLPIENKSLVYNKYSEATQVQTPAKAGTLVDGSKGCLYTEIRALGHLLGYWPTRSYL
jgi:hypothetical protein